MVTLNVNGRVVQIDADLAKPVPRALPGGLDPTGPGSRNVAYTVRIAGESAGRSVTSHAMVGR